MTGCLNSGNWDACLQQQQAQSGFLEKIFETLIIVSLMNMKVWKAVVSAAPLQTGAGRRQVTALQHGSRLSCACSTAVTPRCSHTQPAVYVVCQTGLGAAR